MRFNFFLSFIFIVSFTSFAQERCSTNEHVEILNHKFPQYEQHREKVNFETKDDEDGKGGREQFFFLNGLFTTATGKTIFSVRSMHLIIKANTEESL